MKIIVKRNAIIEEPIDAIAVALHEGIKLEGTALSIDQALNGAITELVDGGDFSGKSDQTAVFYPRGAIRARRVLLVGMGKPGSFNLDTIRRAAGLAAFQAQKLGARQLAFQVQEQDVGEIGSRQYAQALVEGTIMSLYAYPAERLEPVSSSDRINTLILLAQDQNETQVEEGARRGKAAATAVNYTRTLVNHPSNIATPTFLGECAQALAKEGELLCSVYDREWAKAQKMGSFLAVAQGAGQPPRFIVLEYNPPKIENKNEVETLVLVGKGLTFDSGGISLKPAEGMMLMKGDMGGGGAVLGAMKAIADLKPAVRVIGLIPATDNMPDGNAYKPGDVVKAMNGKTIEVENTDAEGRMILADALCYASTYEPAAVIDLATLTGACVVALGQGMAAGIFSNDEELCDKLLAASKRSNERLWPMPLFPEYRKLLDTDVADIRHRANRYSGVGTSATFLKEFTSYPWAHLDIAGMSMNDKKATNAYTPKGATGFGVRLLVDFVMNW